jgi:hypothetical protein
VQTLERENILITGESRGLGLGVVDGELLDAQSSESPY